MPDLSTPISLQTSSANLKESHSDSGGLSWLRRN
jgi:hypothetical protein